MMRVLARTSKPLALAAGSVALLLEPVQVIAQVDTSEWVCQYCPFQQGYETDVSVGADYVSDDALRFGNFTGYDESGAYVALDGEGRYADDNYQMQWYAEDLGLSSRVFQLEGGRQGKFGLYAGYSELPFRQFGTTRTVFDMPTPDTLALPPGWLRASTTSGMTALAASLQARNIESDRKTLTVGANVGLLTNFDFAVDYRHQERDGVDIVSGAGYIRSSLLPRFIDHETDTVDFGIDYSNGAFNLSLGWYGSFFKNNVKSLTWDNPFTGFPGADQGQLAQEPDNDFQQISLSGSYRADALRTVIAFNAATGTGEQDESLLPYTINPLLLPVALPASSLDGKVDTSNYSLTLTSRPLPKARIKVAYRFDERDNRSPVYTWSRVVADAFPSGEDEMNTPYSFERTRLSVSGVYRFLDSLRVSAGYDRTELDRDFQEVAEQTEDQGWAEATVAIVDWLNLRMKGGGSRREIDRYDENVALDLGQNPLLRKYNLAYRYREFGEFLLSFAPVESPVSATLTMRFSDDNYSKSVVGMLSSDSTNYSLDVDWAVTDTASLYLTVGGEQIDALQAGSSTFSDPNWTVEHDDQFDFYGAGVVFRQLGEKNELSLDYYFTDGETHIDSTAFSVDRRFPVIKSQLETLRLRFSHRRSERFSLDLSARYESLETNDWALAGVEPDTIATVLTLGARPYDYDVWVVGLAFRYRIGGGVTARTGGE